MNTSLIYAVAVAILGLVCWPSPRWQRLLLGGLALLARLGVLGTLAGLGIQAIWPGSTPGSFQTVVQNAAERNRLEPATACLLLAVIVACAAVPVLAGLDFARSLADDRGVSQALRAALRLLQQLGTSVDPNVVPTVLPPAVYRAPARPAPENRRRIGDLLDR